MHWGRHGSFSRAAEELFVTQSAVSRQIKLIEESLGIILFERRNRRIILTPSGAQYQYVVRDAFDRIESATHKLREHASLSQINISILPTFAIQWLMPRLRLFIENFPDIDLRISMSTEDINFSQDEFDVAIRLSTMDSRLPENNKRRSQIRVAHLFPDVLVPVCNKDYLEREGPILHPDDVRGHVLLHTSTRQNAWPEWLTTQGVDELSKADDLWFGHFFMTHQAAIQGKGIAMLPLVVVEADLESEKLVPALNAPVQSVSWYSMFYRPQIEEEKSFRQFHAWLTEESARERLKSIPG